MSTENQELTEMEVDEMLQLYEEYAKYEIVNLKQKSKSFKKLRQKALSDWSGAVFYKERVDKDLAKLQQKSQELSKQCDAYRTSVALYSKEINGFRMKIKQLEQDIAPPPEPIKTEEPIIKKEEEEEEIDSFVQRGSGIDISDSEPDPGKLKDIKKNIQLFHDINNAWNQSIREDPELSELLGIDDYEPFGYTSITKKK
jgi:soluble cytochrome b562